MKVCFAGLGSIGKRHLNNFAALSQEIGIDTEIHAFRETDRELEAESNLLLDKMFSRIEDADNYYDAVFICNPTSKHYQTINRFINKTKNMFIEKPLGDNLKEDYREISFSPEGIYYVASPLKFSPVIEYLKKELGAYKIYSVRSICSSYLPDWRKGIDYRECYSAKKDQGGGVTLDLIHEWDYLRYLLGDPSKIMNIVGKYSDLEIDSDDLAVYIADYGDKIVELHLDYFGRSPERSVTIYTDSETIRGDLIKNQIIYCRGNRIVTLEKQDMYQNEMRYFIHMILHGGENRNTIENAIRTIEVANGRIS